MIYIAYILLFGAASWAGWHHYKLWKHRPTSAFAFFALAMVISAVSALANLIWGASTSQDFATFVRITQNLHEFVAIPVIATAMIAIRFDWNFSRPAWGRWILALCAMFELLRRAEFGDSYALMLPLACVIAMAIASTGNQLPRSGKGYMIATLAFAVATLTGPAQVWFSSAEVSAQWLSIVSTASLALHFVALKMSHNRSEQPI